MNLLMIAMQLAGIGLILTAVDVFAVPWLRDALAPSAPESLSGLSDHVVVCGHTPRTDTFVAELDARDREYALVEPDADTARDLHEAGYRVVHGDPESTDALERVQTADATAIVADVADDTNASIVLSARDVHPDGRVVTLVEDAALARYHRVAGADAVLSPRQSLGESLAGEVPTAVTTTVDDGVALGEAFELVELSVDEGSDLHGRTFGAARLRERFGVNVIGAWFGGDFETPVDPDDELDPGTRLLVAGEGDRLADLREAVSATVREFSPRQILLAGYGDAGRAAHEALSDGDAAVTVLDIESKEGVDVVGDARDPDVLAAAGIDEAETLVLAVGDDTAAVFATLIARELNPDLQILVRANEDDDVEKLSRAGADFVQSLSTVGGRMLAATVFEDGEVPTYDEQIRVARLPAPGLAGRTLVDADVRATTGCTVVAVVRNGETIADVDPAAFELAAGDEVVVAGTDADVARFERQFGDAA